jgi:CARDB
MVFMTEGCITPEISSESPDLMAVPEGSFGGPDAYCDMTAVPQLRIVIQNQGQGNASASITRVKFSPGGIVDISTPPLQSAQRTMLAPIRIPAACFDPDCDFTITVDSKAQIDETTGEENNVTDGRCIRP